MIRCKICHIDRDRCDCPDEVTKETVHNANCAILVIIVALIAIVIVFAIIGSN